MLLTQTTSLPSAVAAALTSDRDWISTLYYLGGENAVDPVVRGEVESILK
jgi:hypothetical protein